MGARIDFAFGSMIGVCLFAIASCGEEASHANTAPRAPAGWHRYVDMAQHYSIDIPEGWRIDRSYVYPMRIGGRALHGTAFTVPEALRANTNLSPDTRLTVEAIPDAKSCTARLFLDAPENELTENDGGHAWSVATSGDAGAGNFYDETVYALTDSKPCLAIRYFIHSTNVANYDPGTIKEFDRKALVTAFDRIRGTLSRH